MDTFTALTLLGFTNFPSSADAVNNAFKKKARIFHPDNQQTGDANKYHEIEQAKTALLKSLNSKQQLQEIITIDLGFILDDLEEPEDNYLSDL